MDAKKKSASRLEGKDLITIGIYTVIYVGGAVPFDWWHPLYAVCYKG